MTIWLTLLVMVLLICFSAICSGLNISLMSLEPADLRRQAALGNYQAERVLPLRINSHLTLASLLLTNVAVISASSLVLSNVVGGLWAGIISTLLIVIFGEVLPQALFARFALNSTARFTWLLSGMIIVTYPLSKPLQLLLDQLFGHAEPHLHSRKELGIILSEHIGLDNQSELDEDEVEIMQGALQLSNKHVRDIMTPMKHVYWLKPSTLIDAAKIDEIKEQGWSRLPVFNKELTHCYGILLIRHLLDIDFDKITRRVDSFNLHPCEPVGSMTALDTMFRKFISAHTHLIPVERDDQIVGIVTIEDLLEEILGHEIEDEKD